MAKKQKRIIAVEDRRTWIATRVVVRIEEDIA